MANSTRPMLCVERKNMKGSWKHKHGDHQMEDGAAVEREEERVIVMENIYVQENE